MYDIKIFVEKNGQLGARVNIGKEIIYALGNTPQELIKDMQSGIQCALI